MPGLDTELNDGSTELNLGTGGTIMDESVPPREDLEERHRPRVVIAGDQSSQAVVDPTTMNPDPSSFALPTRDPLMPEVVQLLIRCASAMERCATCLEIIVGGQVG